MQASSRIRSERGLISVASVVQSPHIVICRITNADVSQLLSQSADKGSGVLRISQSMVGESNATQYAVLLDPQQYCYNSSTHRPATAASEAAITALVLHLRPQYSANCVSRDNITATHFFITWHVGLSHSLDCLIGQMQHPRVGVGVIVKKGDKILLGQRYAWTRLASTSGYNIKYPELSCAASHLLRLLPALAVAAGFK